MKRFFRYILIVTTLSLLIFSCEKDIDDIPSLEEQIAQMFLVGFRGTELTADNHIVRDIQDYKIGGVILFERDGPTLSRPRNVVSGEQLKKLVEDLKSYSEEKLLIAIDQEGEMFAGLKQVTIFLQLLLHSI